jgi:hypothetical protein
LVPFACAVRWPSDNSNQNKEQYMPDRRTSTRKIRNSTPRRKAHASSRAQRTRAAAAHTSERVSGDAHETFQSGLNGAATVAGEAADRVAEFFNVTGRGGEELTRRSSESIAAFTQAGTALTRSVQALSGEWLNLMQERLQRNVDGLVALSHCRSVPELMSVQTEFLRDGVQQTLEGTRRMVELSSRLIGEAGRTAMERAPRAAPRRAA